MRTDVKVGLICVFAVILGVVIYFVAQGQDHPRGARGATGAPATASASPARGLEYSAPPSASTVVTTAPAVASTQTAAQVLQLLAQTPPPGGVGGGPILPPSPSTPIGSGGGSFSPPTETPALDGGRPAGTTAGSGISAGGSATSRPYDMGTSGGTGRGVGIDDMGVRSSDRTVGSGRSPTTRSGSSISREPTTPVTPSHPTVTMEHSTGSATVHTVVKGDMLGTIATKYGVTVKAIEAANPGIDSTHLKINQMVNIPAPMAPTVAATHPATTRTASTRPAHTPTTGPATRSAGAPKPGTSYTVKKGDTLSTIALAAYGDKNAWQRIFRANRGDLADANVVTVGTVLRLPN